MQKTLLERINNKFLFTTEEIDMLTNLLKQKNLIETNEFPEIHSIDIGFEPHNANDFTHIVKKLPPKFSYSGGGLEDINDCKYVLIMIYNNQNIIVDGYDTPYGWAADNIEEMKSLQNEWDNQKVSDEV